MIYPAALSFPFTPTTPATRARIRPATARFSNVPGSACPTPPQPRSRLLCVASSLPPMPRSADQLTALRGTWGTDDATWLRVSDANPRGRVHVWHRLPTGEAVRCVDYFDYEESHFTRIVTDDTGRRRIFFSGGWQDDRFEWRRADCGEAWVYERTGADQLTITYIRGLQEEARAVVHRL